MTLPEKAELLADLIREAVHVLELAKKASEPDLIVLAAQLINAAELLRRAVSVGYLPGSDRLH